MTDNGFTPEQALAVAAAAGFDVSDLQRQVEKSKVEPELREKVERVEAKLAEMQRSPQDEEREFAERPRDAMNRSLTPWRWGGSDAA